MFVSLVAKISTIDAEAVESVQRHFTKRLRGLGDKDYNTRLEILKLESLELRRLGLTWSLLTKYILV